MSATLCLSNLSLRRGHRNVLAGGVMPVTPGSVSVIVGANGVGKTSLLEVVAGRLASTGGTCEVDGESVDLCSEQWRSRVAYCPSDGGIIDYLSVAEHIALAHVLGNPRFQDDNRLRADRLPALWGLDRHLSDRGSGLSDGLRKRLGMVLALVSPADLYLFDEPTVSLDADGVRLLNRVLAKLRDSGATALVTSHAPDLLKPAVTAWWQLTPGSAGSILEPGAPPDRFASGAARDVPEDALRWLFP